MQGVSLPALIRHRGYTSLLRTLAISAQVTVLPQSEALDGNQWSGGDGQHRSQLGVNRKLLCSDGLICPIELNKGTPALETGDHRPVAAADSSRDLRPGPPRVISQQRQPSRLCPAFTGDCECLDRDRCICVVRQGRRKFRFGLASISNTKIIRRYLLHAPQSDCVHWVPRPASEVLLTISRGRNSN